MVDKFIQMLFYLNLVKEQVEILRIYVDIEDVSIGDLFTVRQHAKGKEITSSNLYAVYVKDGKSDPVYLCLDKARDGFSITIRSSHVDEDMGKYIESIIEGVEQ